ncbi:MAG TPA: GAF domain-containing protein, partial [Polyangiaceae bacterium]|nr:GAF domain-containing protein [Polyangiaceae bacterium]
MDPLVRALLAVQRGAARASGSAFACGFAAYLVVQTAGQAPEHAPLGVLAGFVGSLAYRLYKRLRALAPEGELRRLDLELLLHLFVGAYAVVLASPGGLDGPFYPLVYAVTLVGSGFTGTLPTVLAAVFAMVLETALGAYALGEPAPDRTAAHAGLLALFAFLNLAVFRAELARVRKLSRARIEGEITRMRDAARSYRLLGAPGTPADSGLTPLGDDEHRLLYSGVDEIHQAVEFALALLVRTLGLRTAMLLGLDANGTTLTIQEVSSLDDAIAPGPFGARDGILGACLERREQVAIEGTRAGVHLPYYTGRPNVGAACATPLGEGRPRGLLVVDREARESFTPSELETLGAAARFIQRAIDNERVFVQLDRAKVEQGKLYRAAGALAKATTEAQVIEAGVNGAREFAAFDFAVVTLVDKATQTHEICAASGEHTESLVGQRFRHNSGLVSMVVANRHALPYRGDYDPSRQVVFTKKLVPPAMPSLLVLPLLVHEKPLGTLVLGSQRRSAFGDSVRPTLEVLASHVAVSLANARMLKRLEEMA